MSHAAKMNSPRQSQTTGLPLHSPKAPSEASWRAARFDPLDHLAARHEGVMSGGSLKSALQGLLKSAGEKLPGNTPGKGKVAQGLG